MRKASIPAVLALALAAIVAPRLAGTPAPNAEAQSPPPSAPGVPVTAGTVASSDVPVFLNAIGTAQAYNMVTIKSRVDGQIVKIAFAEGQDVKAGEPLIQIDPRPFQAALDQAMATKQKDEAQLASAQADLTRWGELLATGAKSRQTYDQQKALVQQLQASIKADEAQSGAPQSRLCRYSSADQRQARCPHGRYRQHGTRDGCSGARHDPAAEADLRQLHGGAGEFAQNPPQKGGSRRARRDRFWRRQQNRTRARQAVSHRQRDRSADRHNPTEGDLRI